MALTKVDVLLSDCVATLSKGRIARFGNELLAAMSMLPKPNRHHRALRYLLHAPSGEKIFSKLLMPFSARLTHCHFGV